MKHEKTFDAIAKLKDVEIELHRLKNALEMANKALDAQRTWVGLTDEEIEDFVSALWPVGAGAGKLLRAIEAKLKEKNNA